MVNSLSMSVVELVDIGGAFYVEQVMDHRVTDECLSIFNENGTMRKVQKSAMPKGMEFKEVQEPEEHTSLVDMGLIWRLATPTKEDREKPDGKKYTWGDYRDNVVDTVMKRHPKAERLILINDPYTLEYSIKDSEKMKRGDGEPVPNVYMKAEKEFPANQEFSKSLTKSENKFRMQDFIKDGFRQLADVSEKKKIIYTVVE